MSELSIVWINRNSRQFIPVIIDLFLGIAQYHEGNCGARFKYGPAIEENKFLALQRKPDGQNRSFFLA
jgi:hypothetical protein